MKIYIAAPWRNRKDARAASLCVEAAGHTITEKWWDKEGPNVSLEDQAYNDWHGVVTADYMVLLNLGKSEGKSVETGIALEHGVPLIIVSETGKKSNLFQHIPSIMWAESLDQAIYYLGAKQ